jgi:hypothetical protein
MKSSTLPLEGLLPLNSCDHRTTEAMIFGCLDVGLSGGNVLASLPSVDVRRRRPARTTLTTVDLSGAGFTEDSRATLYDSYRTIQETTSNSTTPTKTNYTALEGAYAYFNRELFDGILPDCLITMQRKSRAYGFFAGGRFVAEDGSVTDEIALNPSYFDTCSTEDVLSTLVHEMVHLKQHHFGKPSRSAYHNKEWAKMMCEIGLIPSHTGEPGGRQTGQRMSDYIEQGGLFDVKCQVLIADGYTLPYIERWGEREAIARQQKAASKTKYTCPGCEANAWAKPGTKLICGDCKATMKTVALSALL